MSKRKVQLDGVGEAGLTHSPFASLGGGGGQGSTSGAPPRPEEAREPGGAEGARSAARWVVRRERKGRSGKVVTLVEPTGAVDADVLGAAARGLATRLGTGARPKGGVIVVQGDLVERVGRELERLGGEVTLGN